MKFQLLFIFLLMFVFSFEAMAVNTVATVDGENTTLLIKNDNQKTGIFGKISNWYKNTKLKVAKWAINKLSALDFEDPGSVIKLAIVCALGAVAISVLSFFVGGFLWYLGYLLWLAAVVLFWYWVYLKFIK